MAGSWLVYAERERRRERRESPTEPLPPVAGWRFLLFVVLPLVLIILLLLTFFSARPAHGEERSRALHELEISQEVSYATSDFSEKRDALLVEMEMAFSKIRCERVVTYATVQIAGAIRFSMRCAAPHAKMF